MKNLLVTGSSGQLARFVLKALPKTIQAEALFVDRQELDLANKESINTFFAEHGDFETILNLAAYTAVDLAEKNAAEAASINTEAPAQLGAHCKRIIHISTDFVFDGEKRAPYSENDKAQPLSVYGRTKHEGEIKLLQTHPHAVILRTAWLYSELPGNFLTKISQYARSKPELKIVNDQHGTPTYAGDLALVLKQIIEKGAAAGIYHYSNEGDTTWFEFAKYFLEKQGIATSVLPIATADYPTAAKRPAYSVLDKTKIKRELNLQIAPWQESVNVCLSRIAQ